MKAGTTTLFRDLDANPAIFLPEAKEPACLRYDRHLEGPGLAEYAEHFRAARPDQVVGEASTQYTKLPDFPGVPQRALKLLGDNVRIIYLVRNPVSRIISHHYHFLTAGKGSSDINTEVRSNPCYINWTRYAMQIEPWLEAYGQSRVLIVRFEDYVSERKRVVERISDFVGVTPRPDLVDEATAYNQGDTKSRRSPVWDRVRSNRVYRSLISPMISPKLRERLARMVLGPAPKRPALPSKETVDFILEELADEMERLRLIMKSDEPIWDERETRQRYTLSPADAGSHGTAHTERSDSSLSPSS